MRNSPNDDKKYEGNWLGKARHNFYITRRCWQLLHFLCMEYGLNHSSMLEICIREKYIKDIGPLPESQYHNGEKAK
jgi:hypothetical protein